MNKAQLKTVRRTIVLLVTPIIIENILAMVANLISSGMLGRVSAVGLDPAVAIAAQGIGSSVTNIFWNVFKGISIAAVILISKATGAGDDERSAIVAAQTIWILVPLGVVCGLIIALFANPILGFFNPEPEVYGPALSYLRIAAIGMPALAVMLGVTGILQGQGNTRTPMLITAIYNVINIIFGAILIFGLFGQPLGVAGAGAALVIAQYATAGIGLYVLSRPSGVLHELREDRLYRLNRMQAAEAGQAVQAGRQKQVLLRPDFGVQKELFALGIPNALELTAWQAASIVLGKLMLTFGTTAYAANQLGLQAESISEMPALGFGVVATTLTGRAIGAGDAELGKTCIREISKGAMLVISVGMFILLVLPEQAMGLLTTDQEIIELGAVYLRLMGLIQIPQNLQRVYAGALKGAGHTRIPMVIAFIGLWGIRVPLSLILANVFGLGIIAIWTVVCLDQTVRFIITLIAYKAMKPFESLGKTPETRSNL